MNVNQILISDKFKHSDTDFEYFSGYRDDNIFKPLCIILPQMSGYIKYFDNGGKYIYSLLLCLTHVTYVTLHHIVVIRYSTHVTYRTLYHASGDLLIYCECYRFERVFLLSGVFHLALLSAFSRISQGWKFNLKVSRTSCWSSKHSRSPTICLNHDNPHNIYMW